MTPPQVNGTLQPVDHRLLHTCRKCLAATDCALVAGSIRHPVHIIRCQEYWCCGPRQRDPLYYTLLAPLLTPLWPSTHPRRARTCCHRTLEHHHTVKGSGRAGTPAWRQRSSILRVWFECGSRAIPCVPPVCQCASAPVCQCASVPVCQCAVCQCASVPAWC